MLTSRDHRRRRTPGKVPPGGLLTVHDLQTQRQARALVNHETYKGLLAQAQDRIRARALNDCKDLLWQVPPLVPGRPLYKTSHAARYVAEKLRVGGFSVEVASSKDVHVLYVSWNQTTEPRRSPRGSSRSRRPRHNGVGVEGGGGGGGGVKGGGGGRAGGGGGHHVTVEEATRRLDRLKATLGLAS